MKILGIDFGTQRIGLALSYGTLAEPLEIIQNDEQTIERLREICQAESVTDLLVGISEGQMAEQSRAFAAHAAHELTLPLHFVDETLTTKQVEAKMHEAGASRRHRRVDHLAATEMLQEWLDMQGLVKN